MRYKTIQLSKAADIIVGFPFASEKFNLNAQGIRLVRGKNITTGNLRWGDDTRWWDDFSIDLSKYMLKADDIVIGMDGSLVGKNYAKISENDLPLLLVQRVACIRAKEGYDQRFLWGCIASGTFERYIDSIKTGTSIPHISGGQIGNYPIPDFDLQTQKKIAAILSALDEKIAINRAINENLERQAQAIYHERFETVSSDALPSDWRIVTLGEVATISNKSFNPLKNPEIMLEHYSIPAFDEARFPVFESSASIKSNKFIIDGSCFMISKLNPTTKRVWKPYCLTGNAVCSTEFIVYKAMDKSITDFLYSVIDSGSFSEFMCSHVTGSTGSRQRTTPSDTLSYEFILPSEDQLAEFQSLVSPMYAQIRINAIENDKLKRLRDSLLPKLISGEIDASAVQL